MLLILDGLKVVTGEWIMVVIGDRLGEDKTRGLI